MRITLRFKIGRTPGSYQHTCTTRKDHRGGKAEEEKEESSSSAPGSEDAPAPKS